MFELPLMVASAEQLYTVDKVAGCELVQPAVE